MKLNQLVEINEEGLVARAVSFGLMDEPEKNLKLCKGFVFNYDGDRNNAKNTTVGVLDAIRRSFHSRNEPNVHLMIQDYGKGKSHFALTVANFFKLPNDSPEVQGIFKQLGFATSEDNATLAGLKAYKQRGRHLVLCLSGDNTINLQKHFLQVLNKELEAEGIVDSIAQQICKEPLQFLETLEVNECDRAAIFLKSKGYPFGDLQRIICSLKDNNFQVIPHIKEICRELRGVNPDFNTDINIEVILNELITKLCTGEDAQFQGILILFDEVYQYLQNWSADPVGAGGTSLQNITNSCEKHKGKIALVSFSQKNLTRIISSRNVEDYNRLVSRIQAPSSTYYPKASLELVLDGLLKQLQNTSDWESFMKRWGDELRRLNTGIFSNYAAPIYSDLKWKHEQFFKHLTLGCFPLHPMTSYLLCNLSFTQGRSAIDFVQDEVKKFISNDRSVETNEQLNLIYPVALVDAFEGNFANLDASNDYISFFSDYNNSRSKVESSADAEPEEIMVLKAVLLFYTSTERLKKPDREEHEEILKLLTGLSGIRLKQILDKLCKVREVLYHRPGDKTYRFYSGGVGINELRQQIQEETRTKAISVASVEEYCNGDITTYHPRDTKPQEFTSIKKLCVGDWQFENKVYTIANFRSLLQKRQPFKSSNRAGLVAYIIAETIEELQQLSYEMQELLEQHPYRDQIAVAIAAQPVEKIARLILEQEAVNKRSVQELGAALTNLKEQYAQQIKNEVKDLFKSFNNYAYLIDEIPMGDRTSISIVISKILERSYSLIPPTENNDKMSLGSNNGNVIIGYVAKRLFDDDLRPQAFPQASYKSLIDPVFAKSWGLLRLVNEKYKVSVPSQPSVKAAWDKLSEMTHLGERTERTVDLKQIWEALSIAPYGYNAYTFTALLAGWMAYHRNEIFLIGTYGIPQKKADQLARRTEPLKSWVNTNVFDKPKDFIYEWIFKCKPQLIRRKPLAIPSVPDILDSDRAKELLDEIKDFLVNSSDPDKFRELREKSQSLERAIANIDQEFEPVIQVEELLKSASISAWSDVEPLIKLYSDLQNPLSEVLELGITVQPCEDYSRRYHQARQAVIEKIGQAVEIESDRHTKLTTQEDCGGHKANLTQAINRLNQLENLPDRFVVSLQKSLNDTEKARNRIITQKKTDDCVVQIQNVYATLSEMATQQEFISILDQIATLADPIPSVKETETYQNTIDNIKARQDLLVQQFATWESQYDLSMTPDQASLLKDQITPQSLRYTDQVSQNRLQELLQRLTNIILERQSQASEKEKLEVLILNARGKFNDIKSTNSPFESMKYYLQLTDIKLPITSSNDTIQQNLEDIKTEGFTILTQKITQVVELSKRKLEEESKVSISLKSLLPKMQDLANTSDEFTSFRGSLSAAIEELDKQCELLQKRLQDKQVMQAISRYSLAKANTLHLCEEAIAEIETERQKLNFPDEFREKIDSHVQAFREKGNNYNQSLQNLQDELSSVNDSDQLSRLRNNYNKLHQIFVNSSYFSIYQEFEIQVDVLDEDIKVINKLQDLSTVDRANSLSTCDHAIYQIEHIKSTLLETERFSVKLQQLKETLLLRKQGYLSQLTEFQDGLSNSTTTKAAKQVRKQVSEAAGFYQNSEEKQRYESISSESELLVGLLQIFEAQKIDTPEDCAAEIIKLRQWQETNSEIIPMLRLRVVTKLDELESKRQELLSSQRKSTKTWFDRIQQKRLGVEQTNEQTEKILSSSNLLKQINKERSKHEELLEESQKQYLDEAIAFCTDIQSLDREAKIIDLFQELSIAKRKSLHKRLADFLGNSEEES